MRHWIKTGLAEYDFLAGTAPYKLEWGAQVKPGLRLTLAPSWRAAWVSFSEARAIEKLKGNIRSVVPEGVLAWHRERVAGQWAAVATHSTNGHRTPPGRRIAAMLYGTTPLGTVGREIASRYELDTKGHRLHRRTQPICQIFIYHRVNDENDPFFPAVPVTAFRKQMEFLKKNFPIVSLDEIARAPFLQN